ncbi:NAD(P)/FAD-dependent oxidoreductase [Tenacibaculum sp. M341]|uniref:NAD(P)/FAD-dependent oxidoreductase n=1 Tax=Tenacibaculum sp. M341 TaxID=2530339 RepID=UPI00104991D0|nr:NAD(P)/FAD-dependent oxidoreductase [Tenacibaculum sp. M341]TCI84557.1 NAD(P)/FAD-dependent oxidoreductase [Tenacibaculum sp. M341]
MNENQYEVIIIGGSYAGLSAAMTLGRSLRKTLIIDSGKPCNRFTPHSHNFITQDGNSPSKISNLAKEQVLKYTTVEFVSDEVIDIKKENSTFQVFTSSDHNLSAKKVLFASGIKDVLLNIKGFKECWGISVLHCPYCHGYEVHGKKTGIISNGDTGFDLFKLIQNWTDDLTIFTNGPSEFSKEQTTAINQFGVSIIEEEIQEIIHKNGYIQKIILKNNNSINLEAIYSKMKFEHNTLIPVKLGCELTENGYLSVDFENKTSINGIYAAGDNTSPLRTVARATSEGNKAGIFINKSLIEEKINIVLNS